MFFAESSANSESSQHSINIQKQGGREEAKKCNLDRILYSVEFPSVLK